MQEDRDYEAFVAAVSWYLLFVVLFVGMAHNVDIGHTQIITLCIRLEAFSIGDKRGGLPAALIR